MRSRARRVVQARVLACALWLGALTGACSDSHGGLAGQQDRGLKPASDAGDGGAQAMPLPKPDAGLTTPESGASDNTAADSGTSERVNCGMPARAPSLAFCVGSDAGGGEPVRAGKVLEFGAGEPFDSCFAGNAIGRPDRSELGTAKSRWLRIEAADGRKAVLGVHGVDFAWPVGVGDEVQVTLMVSESARADPRGTVELRAADGTLLVWVGIHVNLEALDPPRELRLSQSTEVCRNFHQCVPLWGQYDLRVQLQDGAAHEVGYGAQAVIDEWTVTHGGLDRHIADSTSCFDANLARAAAAITRNR